MRYLLDTNVISEMRKARTPKIDANVSDWTDTVDAGDMFISAITILEIETGILQILRKDKRQGDLLREWFTSMVLREFSGRVLPFDAETAIHCASLHVPDQRSANDAMIAATAFRHDMTVVTRNIKDFEGLGVKLVNPWEWQQSSIIS
ncbi:type II toxin-antitoxin system VapC family toxin [Candidatus Pantoea formicae]|jgi:toxin FitB|uniref:type II toxin-antitoxin system VapC family toxin n=1 Tax=Candidatus Pantoea formicae TaxID=2608355 RepID=UPI003ED9474D